MNVKNLPILLSFSIVLVLTILFFVVRFNVVSMIFPTGAPSPIQTGQVTLEYWGLFEPEEAMKVLIADYEKINSKVRINYVRRREADLTAYKATLLSRMSNNSGPDIFRMHATWTPQYASFLAPAPQISIPEFRQRFYQSAQIQCINPAGSVVCMPLMYDGLVLLYNRDMFNSIGIGIPATWDEVRESAVRLTIRGEGGEIYRAGIALGTSNNVSYSSDILGLMFAQSRVSFPEGIDTDAGSAAITFYTNFARSDKVWDIYMPNSINAFATEKVAMVFAKSDDILDILELNPTIRIGVLKVPQLPDISGKTTTDAWASYWVEGVSAYSSEAEQREAWAFLNWLSQPDQQKKLFAEVSIYKRFGFPYSDRALAEDLQNNIYLSNVINQAEYGIASIISDKSGNDNYVQIVKKAIDTVSNGGDPRRALSTLKQNFAEINVVRR